MSTKTSDYDFELPEELIASSPLPERDASRLLHYSLESKTIKHLNFKDIVDILNPGDILLRNNSKVLPARFYIRPKSGVSPDLKPIEILITKPLNTYVWEIIGKPWKKLKIANTYILENGQELELCEAKDLAPELQNILTEGAENKKFVNFHSEALFHKALEEAGQVPLPPYMAREANQYDKERYQTVYALEDLETNMGSIAAPTAGLHFTDELFSILESKGVKIIDLTLHVGMGTFLPIKSEDFMEHKMHSEYYSLEASAWKEIEEAKARSQRIIAIGSTSARCVEAIAQSGKLEGETNIFIYPGYQFKVIDAMITNFHLPKSSLILLVSALAGSEEIRRIYGEAIREKYRFYSYGDCMFLDCGII